MTIARFEDALLNNNLEALLKDGETAPLDDLMIAWGQIQVDYMDLCGDDAFKRFMKERSTVLAAEIKITHVQLLIQQLFQQYDPVYVEALKAYGYNEKDNYKWDIENPESFIRDLNRVDASLIHDELRRDAANESVEKHLENTKDKKPQNSLFDDSLITIETTLRLPFPLDKYTLTIGKYATYLNMVRKQTTK